MQKIRYGLVALSILFCSVTSAKAEISIGIGLPNVSIGINLPLYPQLVPVPGYPVYYAPQLDANYFFYDGMYWVYQDDNWYASSWYNGPWGFVEPEVVPLFVLRIPVRYYRQPPVYFRGWQSSAPPRWGQHWGHEWEQRRGGWDRWKRSAVPGRAPLPVYQRQYSGDRYPHRVEQQRTLRSQSYRYQPRDKAVRQHFKQIEQKAPAAAQQRRQEAAPDRRPGHDDQRRQVEQKQQREQRQQVEQKQQREQRQQVEQKQQREQRQQHEQKQQRSVPLQQGAPATPRTQPPQRGGEHVQRPAPAQQQAAPQQRGPAVQDQRRQPAAAQREQQPPRVREQKQKQQDSGEPQEPDRRHGQGQGKDEERGRGR